MNGLERQRESRYFGSFWGSKRKQVKNVKAGDLNNNMAVCSDIFLFIICLLDTGGLVFLLIYFIITLSDLECDYLNAQECCAKLNFVSFNRVKGR